MFVGQGQFCFGPGEFAEMTDQKYVCLSGSAPYPAVQESARFDGQACLFPDFTDQALLGGFLLAQPAARKIPLATVFAQQ